MRFVSLPLLACGGKSFACGVAGAAVMAALGFYTAHCRAFTAGPGQSTSSHPLILPFEIGKPATDSGNPAASSTGISRTLSPAKRFHIMGWPWVKHQSAESQPSQRQINQDLLKVLQGMGASARRLQAADAGITTQDVQKKIIARLDELIKMAQQSQGNGGGREKSSEQQSMAIQQSNGEQNFPMTPSQSATHSRRPGGTPMNPGDLKNFTSRRHEWGNLPARERNMILNAMRHQTLPQYKSLVRQYYESLAKLNQPK